MPESPTPPGPARGEVHSIVSLTLSPALDIATSIARLRADAKLRCSEPVYAPGGGDINVTRALVRLGGKALAMFPAGGSSGQHLVDLLEAEAVPCQPLEIAERTRECLNVVEQASGQQYRFVMPGAPLSAAEQQRLLDALEALASLDYLVVSGSLPEGMATDFLVRVLQLGRRRGARCILDTSGEPLRQAVKAGGLFLIKPNFNELRSLADRDIDDPQQLIGVARALVSGGRCENVLVSLGAQGALLVGADHEARIAAPTVQARSTVGAGDSLVAGVTLKLAAGAAWPEALRFGVAAGTAAIMTEGSELCRRQDTERLYAWMQG